MACTGSLLDLKETHCTSWLDNRSLFDLKIPPHGLTRGLFIRASVLTFPDLEYLFYLWHGFDPKAIHGEEESIWLKPGLLSIHWWPLPKVILYMLVLNNWISALNTAFLLISTDVAQTNTNLLKNLSKVIILQVVYEMWRL